MYNKTASIILNSAKTTGLSDVYVAQPDSLKENLAGKIFILAEISGKKADGRKIFDFLISSLEDNYYNDEKIIFRDKIEGLKVENIFEAAITKTNKNLTDFLADEKIRFNPAATSITIGVVYENKIHFANFGRNRALLIYRHGSDYELINVEASASETNDQSSLEAENAGAKMPKLFSSVISGEVPIGSYFIFASESLPEYLSGKEMINIITKLPPITAAEQVKNVLAKINTYVPFLGIIIKNTTGLAGQETKEEVEESSSAHSSISSLNYTEQKTEQMLAPAGLISFTKMAKSLKRIINGWRPKLGPVLKKYHKPSDDENQPPLDLGTVKSLNMARSDSFLLKEKIFFKKKTGRLKASLRQLGSSLAGLFSPHLWSALSARLGDWFKSLNSKNRLLFISLSLIIIIFLGSLYFTNRHRDQQIAQTNFDNLVTAIQDKENAIDSHLLYNDEAGAAKLLIEAQALLDSLPKKNSDQQAVYEGLLDKFRINQEKIQKIVRISQADKTNDLAGLNVSSLIFSSDNLYAASGPMVYGLTPNSASSTRLSAKDAKNLSNPFSDRKDRLYYWDGDAIVQINTKSKTSSRTGIAGLDQAAGLVSFKTYQDRFLYLISKNNNQIYKYTKTAAGYGAKSEWLKETVDLSQASDLYIIDGDIYVLRNTGEVLKLYLNKRADYQTVPILPAMTTANKLIVGANHIYIFEAASKRLVVLAKKDGRLMNQYQIDSLSQPKDFTVNEAGKTAYFLDGEAVYKISLNQ